MTSVKHHYTPRHYLSRFENDDGKIWRLEVGTAHIVTGNRDHFGFKNHWNRLRCPPDGYSSDWAEKKIAEIDGYAASTLKRLVGGEFPTDISALAFSIGFMTQHQPVVHKDLAQAYSDDIKEWSSDWQLIASLDSALKKGAALVPKGYAIYRLSEDQAHLRFMTSSNPLVEFDNKPTKLFPISSRECLQLSYDQDMRMSRKFLACDEVLVSEINKLIATNAWQYVYSCRADFTP